VSNSAHDAVLATGASSSTGATFADRLAPCGYDLVQVPRNKDQLETNASRLRSKVGVALEIVRDGLTVAEGPARLESRQLRDGSTGLFVDNAGAPVPGDFVDPGKNTLRPVFARERKQPILWRIRQ
jgi:short-subunit dehydrogenase